MKSPTVFVAGLLAGAGLATGIAVLLLSPDAAVPPRPARALNHIGIVVDDYAAAYAFYTERVGLKEAYTVERNGSPLLTYLQLNRETFVELIPARGNEPRGVTHFGMEVRDIDAFVAQLRAGGMTVADPGTTPANARFVRIRDASGIEIEVMEYGPESSQYQAMAAWQD